MTADRQPKYPLDLGVKYVTPREGVGRSASVVEEHASAGEPRTEPQAGGNRPVPQDVAAHEPASPAVVALVDATRRFVEHEHIRKFSRIGGADLGELRAALARLDGLAAPEPVDPLVGGQA